MTAARTRARMAHLGVAMFTAGVVYSPAFDAQAVRTMLRFAVLPALALTGAVLWALPRLRRLARRGSGVARAADPVSRPRP